VFQVKYFATSVVKDGQNIIHCTVNFCLWLWMGVS